MNDIIMKLKNIEKRYSADADKLYILRDLNLEIEKGEFISILGRSGSGKSTLLNIMGMLDKPDSGQIFIDGKEVEKLRSSEIDKIKNETMGFVFQFHYLLPEFTALENVMLPAMVKNHGDRSKIEARAKEILKAVGLEERTEHKPNQLSGGEKQRVAIARAMINDPKILLADEPTGNLDEETSENIFGILRELNEKIGQTIVVVTHSMDLAAVSKKRYHLRKGVLEEER